MLLSDRDIKASLDSGRIQLDPLDRDLVQPASIDVRLDRLFRLFDNHRYPVIDPAADQSDLTHQVDVGPDQPFVLHPGEFVLGALGIHNFYLGYTSKGIIQLILTITMIGAPIAAIWALIEFVLILAHSGSYAYDAQGQPLQ